MQYLKNNVWWQKDREVERLCVLHLQKDDVCGYVLQHWNYSNEAAAKKERAHSGSDASLPNTSRGAFRIKQASGLKNGKLNWTKWAAECKMSKQGVCQLCHLTRLKLGNEVKVHSGNTSVWGVKLGARRATPLDCHRQLVHVCMHRHVYDPVNFMLSVIPQCLHPLCIPFSMLGVWGIVVSVCIFHSPPVDKAVLYGNKMLF